MPTQLFTRQLLILTLVMIVVLLGLHWIPLFSSHWPLSLASLLFFVGLSIGMFFLANYFIRQNDRTAFIPLVMFFVLIKIFFSIIIVAVYFYQQSPTNKFFVVPFFIIYLGYTIFETSFMMRMSRINPDS